MIKRIITVILALVLAAGTFSFSAARAEGAAPSGVISVRSEADGSQERNDPIRNESGYLLNRMPGTPLHSTALSDAFQRGEKKSVTRDILPARYDGRDYGYLQTEVRDQAMFGTCWAHATIASVETYMIKNGVTDGATGKPASRDIDLSEYALAFFTYNKAYDKLGLLSGDESYFSDFGTDAPVFEALNSGGTEEHAALALMRWEGAASESVPVLDYGSISPDGIDPAYSWQYDSVHVQNYTQIPASNKDAVKRMLMEYGAAAIPYYDDENYYNFDNGSYYDPDRVEANHVVALVGWDDDYPADNFKEGLQPEENGAWIVKNSWGDSWGDGGYEYISYETGSVYVDPIIFLDAEPVDNFDNNYQYDGTVSVECQYLDTSRVCNTYVAKGDELLEAVSFMTKDEDLHYTVSVFLNNVDVDDDGFSPDYGILASEASGTMPFCGYHTVRLDAPVLLHEGQVFSVAVGYALDEGEPFVPVDASNVSDWIDNIHSAGAGRSFAVENGEWIRVEDQCSFRIKAYTSDLTPIDETSLSFYAEGVLIDTHTGDVGSLYTLPTSAPTPDGYRFIGWSEGRFVDVNAEPRYYLPGETVLMSPSLTSLFALYATDINENTVFTRTCDVPDGWCGKFVFTSTPDGTGFVLGGEKVTKGDFAFACYSNIRIDGTGIAIDGTSMTGVEQEMIYKISKRSGVMTIRNALYGFWLEPEDWLLFKGYFSGIETGWTLAAGDGGAFSFSAVYDKTNGKYPYIGVKSNGQIEMMPSPCVYLWRAEEDYRTEPIPALPHIPGDINGDGENGTGDAVRMMKNLSGVPVTGNPYALDVNGDGAFDLKDLVRLLKFLSGADVDIF